MIVKTKNSMQDELTKAKGVGSSKSGTDHWLGQHVSSVALIPLVLYVLISFLIGVVFQGGDYATARAWVHAPWNGLALILLIGTAFFHGANGMQSGIVEDYIHHPGRNLFGFLAIKFLAVTLAAVGVLAVLKIMLGS
jgi:succinate dehydrogenase / fumarate reductase membrane anchor subunit